MSRRIFSKLHPSLTPNLRPRAQAPPLSPFHSFHSSTAAMANKDWSAQQYLKFESERTRPSRDLLAQVPLVSPKRIIDLGCGPGNSTAVLAARYPQSHLTGMDSSPDMIEKAKAALPSVDFALGNLNSYTPEEPVDLFFSNAVFQWLSFTDRINIIKRLIESQSSGGVFAFQVPDNFSEPSHAAMRETAADGPWAEMLERLQPAREVFQTPQELYDAIKPLCSRVDLWHTHYHHVLENHAAIVEWVKGTGLRPFIDPLSPYDREAFLKAYLGRLEKAYESQYDGKVILRYPRLFMVAVRT